jgi:hypothetical protein
MSRQTTWQPLAAPFDINDNGKLDPRERRELPDSAFAFPSHRELPLVDAERTREAIASMNEFWYVPEDERALAANNIRAAARYYGIALTEPAR